MKNNRDTIRRITHAICDIDGAYDEIAKSAGVKENLLWTLYALDDGIFHTQKEISENWKLPKTTVNTIVKECVRDGFAELETAEKDKRELEIVMTERGKAYATEVLRFVYDVEQCALEKTLENCSPNFVKDLEQFSRNFLDALEEKRKNKRTPNVL